MSHSVFSKFRFVRTYSGLGLVLLLLCLTIPSRAASIAATTESSVPLSSSSSVFDVNAHPSNVYGLGTNTTLDPVGFDVRDLFGGAFDPYTPELHNVIYQDQTRGFVNSVVVTLDNPV